jgi:hypothetical protein
MALVGDPCPYCGGILWHQDPDRDRLRCAQCARVPGVDRLDRPRTAPYELQWPWPDNYVASSTCPVCFERHGSLVVCSSQHAFAPEMYERICALGHRWRVDYSTQPTTVTILEDDMTDTLNTPDVAIPIEVSQLQEQLAQVVAERDSALDHMRSVRTDAEQLRANISTIGARLLSEAQDRGWCSDFDVIVRDLNSEMYPVEGGLLPAREFNKRITVQVELSVEGTGTAANVGEAIQSWLMHDVDNTEDLTDRCESRGILVTNSVVHNVSVVAD